MHVERSYCLGGGNFIDPSTHISLVTGPDTIYQDICTQRFFPIVMVLSHWILLRTYRLFCDWFPAPCCSSDSGDHQRAPISILRERYFQNVNVNIGTRSPQIRIVDMVSTRPAFCRIIGLPDESIILLANIDSNRYSR